MNRNGGTWSDGFSNVRLDGKDGDGNEDGGGDAGGGGGTSKQVVSGVAAQIDARQANSLQPCALSHHHHSPPVSCL